MALQWHCDQCNSLVIVGSVEMLPPEYELIHDGVYHWHFCSADCLCEWLVKNNWPIPQKVN